MKVVSLIFALCFAYGFGTAQFNYVFTTSMQPYENLTGSMSINNDEVWDDPEYVVNLPFTFELNGHPITSLSFLGSGSDLGAEFNPDEFVAVAPFSVDLIDRGFPSGVSQSPISYTVEGNPGSRIVKIEWNNAGSLDELDALGTTEMFVNFQLWFFEGSNRIEMHYGPSMITDPDLFYIGETGAIIGVATVDENAGMIVDINFLSGPASAPMLSDEFVFIDGTPENGVVYTFSVNLPLDVEVSGTDGTCGLPNGSATANASGGVEPYTYDWSNGGDTQTISDLEEGTYTVTVSDASGSTATGIVTIENVTPVNPNAFATHETALNANDGTATSAAVGGTPLYAFLWSNGSTDQQIIGLSPGSYTVTVTDSEGCTGTETVTVNAFGCDDIFLEVALSNISCFGECNTAISILEVIGGTPPYTYAWSTGNIDETISDLCAGVYTVTVTDANGCTVIETYEIFQPEELLVNATSTDESAQGANDGTATSSPTGGIEPYEFLWNNGSTNAMIIGLAPGSYTVIVTDVNFCLDTQTVVVNSSGCVLSLMGNVDDASCVESCDGSVIVTPLNATQPVSYLWSTASMDSISGNLCAGNYSVTIEDATGCTFTSGFIVGAPPQLFANAAGSDESAQGANDCSAWVAPSGGTPPYTYAWNNGSTDSLITGLAPGEYAVVVNDANGCIALDIVIVNAFSCVSLIESVITPISCFEACDGAISFIVLDGIGPFTYEWTTGDTTNAIDGLCSGSYGVSITDAGQNCVGLAGFFLSEPEPLSIDIDEVINITDTTQSMISISASGGAPPYSYLWSGPDGFNSANEDISGMDAGQYSVVVTDANGCTIQTGFIEVIDETVGTGDIPSLDVRVYPNPSTGLIHIEVLETTEFIIQLRSLDGRIVETWETTNVIDVSSYPVGLYTLRLISGNGEYTCRLILQ